VGVNLFDIIARLLEKNITNAKSAEVLITKFQSGAKKW
jgi:hypothetical protein